MANDIKIAASMDVASFRQVDNAIKSLVSSVERLKTSMSGVAQGVQKIQTGSSVPGATPIKGAQGQKGGGIVGAILGTGEGQGVNKLVTDANRAFDSVSRRISTFTDKALRDMQRLNGARPGDAGWYDRATSAVEDRRFLTGAGPSFGGFGGGRGGGGAKAPSGAPIPGGGGFSLGGVASGLPNSMSMLMGGNVSGFLGSTLGRLGIAGAAVYGGYRIADSASSYVNDVYGANQQYALKFPIQLEQASAASMSPFKSLGSDLIRGNLTGAYGMEAALSSKAIGSVLNTALRKETITTKMNDNVLSGRLKNEFSKLVDPVATKGFDSVANNLTTILSTGAGLISGGIAGGAAGLVAGRKADETPLINKRVLQSELSRYEINESKLKADLAPEMASDLESIKQAKIHQLTSGEQYILDSFSGSGPMGRVKTLRASGRSTAPIRMKDGTERSAYEYYESRANRGGWDLGDDASEYQQLLSIGRGYKKIFGGHELVSAGIEGFGNLGQITKTAGIIGGNLDVARVIKNNINGSNGLVGGTNGLDVAVGRELFQQIAQNALGTGMYGASSLNQVNRMQATFAFAGGADVAGQQRNAYGLGLANDLQRSYTSGSRSAFDKVASWQYAINATGDTYDASTIRLREMAATDPNLLASIAFGGAKVPKWAEGLIDKGSARKYLTQQRGQSFANVTDSLWTGERRANLKILRENNSDPNKLLDKMLEGKGKVGSPGWFKAEREATEYLSGYLSGNKMAHAYNISQGYLREKIEALPRPKGPGAHAAAPKSREKAALEARAAYEAELSEYMFSLKPGEGPDQNVVAQIGKKYHIKDTEQMQKMAGSGDINQAADNFARAANALRDAIKTIRGHRQAGGPG